MVVILQTNCTSNLSNITDCIQAVVSIINLIFVAGVFLYEKHQNRKDAINEKKEYWYRETLLHRGIDVCENAFDNMENIINNLINNFDFTYMLAINILTYIIIKTIDSFNGTRKVKTYIKRICLLTSILIVTILYKYNGYDNDIILINSAIASPIAWSWIFKPLFNKIGIGYNKNKK